MKIISGDEFGLIKLISTKEKKVIDQYGSLDSSKSIINIFSNFTIKENDNDENSEYSELENLNLFVSSLHENYVLNWETKRKISSYNNENADTNFISSTIKFPSNDNKNTILINGTSDNKLNVVSFNDENKFINSSCYIPLDNPNMKPKIILKGTSNSIYNKDCIYALYKNSSLVLYNIQEKKIEFKGKNLPNDELNLSIPIYDTDIIEVKNNPRLNYVSTAYGEIRLYDKKASPKPSLNKKVTNSKINKLDITEDGNYLFIGDSLGYCAMLDIRKSFSPCRTFKGNTGSIQTLVNIEQNNNIIVGGFDRFVKWYDYKNGDDGKVFVKNKVNSAILVGLEKNEEFEDEEEGEIDDSELLEEEEEEEKEKEDNENDEEELDEQNESNNNEENEDEEREEEEEQEKEEEDESGDNNASNNLSSDKYEEEDDEGKNEGELEEEEGEESGDKNKGEGDSNEDQEEENEDSNGEKEEELDEEEEEHEENSDNNEEQEEESNKEEKEERENEEEEEERDLEEEENEEESDKLFKKRKREKIEEEEEEEEDSSRPNKNKKRKLF